jgi:hypothetical protein
MNEELRTVTFRLIAGEKYTTLITIEQANDIAADLAGFWSRSGSPNSITLHDPSGKRVVLNPTAIAAMEIHAPR